MPLKNIIAAITLSTAVIVLYSLFFIPEQSTTKNLDKNKVERNTDAPEIEKSEIIKEISREEALNKSERIFFENENFFNWWTNR